MTSLRTVKSSRRSHKPMAPVVSFDRPQSFKPSQRTTDTTHSRRKPIKKNDVNLQSTNSLNIPVSLDEARLHYLYVVHSENGDPHIHTLEGWFERDNARWFREVFMSYKKRQCSSEESMGEELFEDTLRHYNRMVTLARAGKRPVAHSQDGWLHEILTSHTSSSWRLPEPLCWTLAVTDDQCVIVWAGPYLFTHNHTGDAIYFNMQVSDILLTEPPESPLPMQQVSNYTFLEAPHEKSLREMNVSSSSPSLGTFMRQCIQARSWVSIHLLRIDQLKSLFLSALPPTPPNAVDSRDPSSFSTCDYKCIYFSSNECAQGIAMACKQCEPIIQSLRTEWTRSSVPFVCISAAMYCHCQMSAQHAQPRCRLQPENEAYSQSSMRTFFARFGFGWSFIAVFAVSMGVGVLICGVGIIGV